MGRGNVCVTGPYEGLYYIDNDYINVYRSEEPVEMTLQGNLSYEELTSGYWEYDDFGTSIELDDIEDFIVEHFTRMFPSFEKKEGWLDRSRRVLLESKLFYVCMEDNEWSVAVELIQKEEPWGMSWMPNIQKHLYQKYLDGLKLCLLDRLPSIGTYRGAWMHGTLRREDLKA